MNLDTKHRTILIDRILNCLEGAAPSSNALLRGSLADNNADQYSDIDVLWEIPDSLFKSCIDNLEEILLRVHPVESFRSDPDFQNSEKRRLIYVRFEGIPLFWRLDLDIFAQSINRDGDYDLHNPDARGSDWSLTESALMNTVGAVKAHLRNKDEEARKLLLRAYQRVGIDFPNLELRELLLRLAEEIKVIDPNTCVLAEKVKKLVLEVF